MNFSFLQIAVVALTFACSSQAFAFTCNEARQFDNATPGSDTANVQRLCYGNNGSNNGGGNGNGNGNGNGAKGGPISAPNAGYSNLGEYLSKLPQLMQEEQDMADATKELEDYASKADPQHEETASRLAQMERKAEGYARSLSSEKDVGSAASKERFKPNEALPAVAKAPLRDESNSGSGSTQKLDRPSEAISDGMAQSNYKKSLLAGNGDTWQGGGFLSALSGSSSGSEGSGLSGRSPASAEAELVKTKVIEQAKRDSSLRDKLMKPRHGGSEGGADGSRGTSPIQPVGEGSLASASGSVFDSAGGKEGFSMSGSDTDAAIKQLIGSLDDERSGIMGSESQSLFVRVTIVHRAAAQSGLVTR